VDFGVHLPLLAWGETRFDLATLIEYVRTADRLGFSAVSMNDHVQFRRPWLDGPTALASVLAATGEMAVATTIAERESPEMAETLDALRRRRPVRAPAPASPMEAFIESVGEGVTR
jgi:alkanesulfonate monooxygenase SsuD/methylene tetrahydromethanopterin reductase-like flavin-dependent oxidoreductase (luciferase family)